MLRLKSPDILLKGVEEVKHLKKEIADLKAKTKQILGEASCLGSENLKLLEQVLDEGLASVKAKKDQLLKETKKKLDISQKKEQEATMEIATLRSEEQKVAMEDATLKGKIEELQGQLEDRAPREYSPKSDVASSHETKCLTEACPNLKSGDSPPN